ncbi:MAG: GNAT family N-acetyltransferase [Anaerolineaceae bacterium]|nr:GNAT family N-acetyltransferase [Anaerolineaceae bacterium]
MLDEKIVRITEKDIPAAAGVHTRAFLDYPYALYTLKDGNPRPHQLYHLMVLTLRYACRYGEVYATPGMQAIAAWIPPDVGPDTNWRMIRVGALPVIWKVGPAAIRSCMVVRTIAHGLRQRHVTGPHWYLSQLGVEPHLQGQGFGRRLLTPKLRNIDRQGMAVYLETSNPRAIPFYERLGFHICEKVDLPKGGPPLWPMMRNSKQGE